MTNFMREVHCILGLPFDSMSMSDALDYVRDAAKQKKSCIVATPNLNFIVASRNDSEFRASIIKCDLSIADGMPIIWIANLLKIPVFERVAGADLYEKLNLSKSTPLKVFFFGGAEGIAEQACQRQNENGQGLTASGFFGPGFGTVEEMSAEKIIQKINASDADFIVVALGAKKGHAWIEANRDKLKAPIISHLGAVINFVAGNIKRAPHFLQIIGMEWLWRIYQEPSLWVRYGHDGLSLCKMFLSKVIPYAFWRMRNKKLLNNRNKIQVESIAVGTEVQIVIKGACVNHSIEPLKLMLCEKSEQYKNYQLNLQLVPAIDSAFIGLCLLLSVHAKNNGGKLVIININDTNRKIINWNCAQFLLVN